MMCKFDVGLLVSTFYMLAPTQEERIAILKNLIKYIKPGGKVVILDPNPLCPLFYPYYLLHPRVRWAIEKNFLYSNRWNMKRIYKRMGLKNVAIYPYGFFPGLNKFLPYFKWPKQGISKDTDHKLFQYF